MRDNKICTKCCEVIHITGNKVEWLKWRKFKDKGGDLPFIAENWKPIKKRLAKKKNPYMFKILPKNHGMSFYKCTKLKKGIGCSIHKDRSQVCSGYPWYGEKPYNDRVQSTYTPSCTVFYEIPIKMID